MTDTTTEAPAPNEPAARTADGTLLNQNSTSTTTDSTTATDATQTEPSKTDAPKGAPETYADFTAPEGVKLDPEAVKAASALFKEQGFTQEQAQAVLNATAKREADLIKRANDAYATQRADWRNEVVKEFSQARLDSEVRPAIGRALDTLDPKLRDEFRNAMDLTGAGDNPAFVKAFYAFAQKINEGKAVAGAPQTEQPKRPSLAGSMYPQNQS